MESDLHNFSKDVWEDLGEPTSPSQISISGWASANIGTLNLNVNESVTIDSSGNFSPRLPAELSGIYREIYKIKYYNDTIRKISDFNFDTTALNWSEMREGDSTIKRVNPSEIMKIYRGMKNDAEKELRRLVSYYRSNYSLPYQVVGEDGD